jgi:hypothetical protein
LKIRLRQRRKKTDVIKHLRGAQSRRLTL